MRKSNPPLIYRCYIPPTSYFRDGYSKDIQGSTPLVAARKFAKLEKFYRISQGSRPNCILICQNKKKWVAVIEWIQTSWYKTCRASVTSVREVNN